MKHFIALTLLLASSQAFAAKITDDMLKIGRSASGNKTIELNIGSSTNPKIRYNSSSSKIEFTNNGSDYSPLTRSVTIQKFAVAGTGTYTLPTNPKPAYLRVRIVGGGGGGGGGADSTDNGGTGGSGGTSSFGTSLLTVTGGAGAKHNQAAPGSATLSSPAYGTSVDGNSGTSGGEGVDTTTGVRTQTGGAGSGTAFGSGGAGSNQAGNGTGTTAVAYGAGGGGGGTTGGGTNTFFAGAGGASGAYIDAIIPTPSSTYAYVVGAGGAGGTAGSSGYAGGAGAVGYIIVEEFY